MRRFRPVKRERIAKEIEDQLKTVILADLQSGQKLPSERDLIKEFEVSRVVIREAIRSLEAQGFLTVRQGPNGGAFVTEPSYDHLGSVILNLFLANRLSATELCQVRLFIEPEVVRLAAFNVTPEYGRRLESALEAESLPTESHTDRVYATLKVHYILAEMCGNRVFEAFTNSLLGLTQEILGVIKPSHIRIHKRGDHVQIVNCVTRGDAESAGVAMAEHIASVRKTIINLEQTYRQRMGLKK